MGAALFWTVALATALAQGAVVHCWSVLSNSPWDSYGYYAGLWPYTYDPYGSSWQAGSLGDLETSRQQDGAGGMKEARGASTGASSPSRFGGDYGFPRYGGSSRISRYGIDYGSRSDRGQLPSAYSFGDYGDSGFYPGYTNELYGREHPRSWYWFW
uniref:Putative glycine rich protein n=1 Tax=Amblyomma parvum TaxID=251391 RepID=A0A023G2G4_AMBPA